MTWRAPAISPYDAVTNSTRAVEALIVAGADLNLQDARDGSTAAILAAFGRAVHVDPGLTASGFQSLILTYDEVL